MKQSKTRRNDSLFKKKTVNNTSPKGGTDTGIIKQGL